MQSTMHTTPRHHEPESEQSYPEKGALGVAAVWLVFYMIACVAGFIDNLPASVTSLVAIP